MRLDYVFKNLLTNLGCNSEHLIIRNENLHSGNGKAIHMDITRKMYAAVIWIC